MIHPGFLNLLERRELVACVRSQREDHEVARRAKAILLLDDGESCIQIAKCLNLGDDTTKGLMSESSSPGRSVGIHLIQLPPYCPHLNPIERLWAVMHQYVTQHQYYPTQKQFANDILRFFRETLPKEWKTFRSQRSDNFRVVTHDIFRVLGRKRYNYKNRSNIDLCLIESCNHPALQIAADHTATHAPTR